MIVSTKGRYALRVMVHFAMKGAADYIPLKEIAEAEGISQKYLESIMTTLSKAGFVDAVHGKGGGYRLNRSPADYTVGSILKLTEGSLAAVSCTSQGPAACSRSTCCQTKPMWDRLDAMINDFFEGITLADLLEDPQQLKL
ncbi:MAG: RrF2 family transcriptional regulator [Oscillospiraceae bacterium]|nr:RrF2 family transcriptional regulator [Oscillospiraceae bacterium]